MRVLLLGCGLQGRATLHDLARSAAVGHVTCAEYKIEQAEQAVEKYGRPGFVPADVDATNTEALRRLISQGYDVVIDMLPRQFVRPVAEAAIAERTHLVNTYYNHDLRPLAGEVEAAGIAVLPEMGLDPGIDLVMAGHVVDRLHGQVRSLYSYGGGIPELVAANNPLRYKISWNFEGVLNSYYRPARLMRNGVAVDLDADEIFQEENLHEIQVPNAGTYEAFPNGDATYYAKLLGIEATIKNAGRYALRYQGHGAVWRTFSKLGLLEHNPEDVSGQLSPRQFLRQHLEPRLRYGDQERDMVILRIEAESVDEKVPRLILELIDYRDMESGLMAMNRTVGYPASIAAQMIVTGEIANCGLLNSVRDVPYEPFCRELSRRNLHIIERREPRLSHVPAPLGLKTGQIEILKADTMKR